MLLAFIPVPAKLRGPVDLARSAPHACEFTRFTTRVCHGSCAKGGEARQLCWAQEKTCGSNVNNSNAKHSSKSAHIR